MSLIEASLLDVVKKQYFFKLKAYIDVFSALIAVQVFGLLFSAGGVGMMGTGSGGQSLSVTFVSADIVIFFTMLWTLMSAILITTKAYRNGDFTFVMNRMSRNLANIAFLLTISIIGGITAMFAGTILKVITYFVMGGDSIITPYVTPYEFLLGILVATLYMLLLSAVGYFIGSLVQLSRALIVLVPILIIGGLFLNVRASGEATILGQIFRFFAAEESLFLFCLKVLLVVVVLFGCSILLSNRMEVRK